MQHAVPLAVWARLLVLAGLLLSTGITAISAQEATPFPAPKSLGDVKSYGKNIQRTMRLLETSTPEKRNTVKILFYGQSITEQAWAKQVADDLKKRNIDDFQLYYALQTIARLGGPTQVAQVAKIGTPFPKPPELEPAAPPKAK